MLMHISSNSGSFRHLVAGAILAGLTACGPAPVTKGINDPAEPFNRRMHELNRGLDKVIVRPASQGYGKGTPGPIRQAIANFASNISLPSGIVNGVLQGRPHNAAENTFRFVINTTVGIGGIFDPASVLGLKGKPTDFGETLHVWGVGEGPYVELPIMRPAPARDMVGYAVDLAMNPVALLAKSPEAEIASVLYIASKLGERYRYSSTVDSLLYESADSYAQTRLLTLQYRRFQLGQTSGDDAAYQDPYEDPYADPYAQ
jgi:phospholipid-binding lipoprotein MlaA